MSLEQKEDLIESPEDKDSNNPSSFTCLNEDVEREVFFRHLEKSKVYFEFGSGGSTFKALNMPIKKVYSVESSRSWYDSMCSYKFITENMENKKLNYMYVNTGETKEWAYPVDDSTRYLWPNYSRAISTISSPQTVDTVLVDGRFRVACVLMSILVCKPDTTIIIHDFWDRPNYHAVLEFLEVIEQAGTLGVFKIKDNLDKKRIEAFFEVYQYVCV